MEEKHKILLIISVVLIIFMLFSYSDIDLSPGKSVYTTEEIVQDWYEENWDEITGRDDKAWYETDLFFCIVVICPYTISYFVIIIRYSKKLFNKYYSKSIEPKPKFGIQYIWTGPHIDDNAKEIMRNILFIFIGLIIVSLLFGAYKRSSYKRRVLSTISLTNSSFWLGRL